MSAERGYVRLTLDAPIGLYEHPGVAARSDCMQGNNRDRPKTGGQMGHA